MLTTLPLSKGRVAFQARGNGAPLVLIHGVGLQSAAWGPQIETLSRTHHVIALDMPGHGESDPLPVGTPLEGFIEWTVEVLEALDLGPVNLAGHSMGALIAGSIAVHHPQKLAKVALLNGVHRRSAEATQAVQTRAAQIAAGQMDAEAPLARWFDGAFAQCAARDQTAGWLRAVNLEGYATAYAAFAEGDGSFADGLSGVSCPLLALTGSGDPNSTPQMAHDMAAAAPDGTAVVIEGHRHMVNLTAPDLVNAHLLEWLDRPQSRRIAS